MIIESPISTKRIELMENAIKTLNYNTVKELTNHPIDLEYNSKFDRFVFETLLTMQFHKDNTAKGRRILKLLLSSFKDTSGHVFATIAMEGSQRDFDEYIKYQGFDSMLWYSLGLRAIKIETFNKVKKANGDYLKFLNEIDTKWDITVFTDAFVEFLISNDCINVNNPALRAFFIDCKYGRPSSFYDALEKRGFNFSKDDIGETTLLIMACKRNNIEVGIWAISRCDVNARDRSHHTAMTNALLHSPDLAMEILQRSQIEITSRFPVIGFNKRIIYCQRYIPLIALMYENDRMVTLETEEGWRPTPLKFSETIHFFVPETRGHMLRMAFQESLDLETLKFIFETMRYRFAEPVRTWTFYLSEPKTLDWLLWRFRHVKKLTGKKQVIFHREKLMVSAIKAGALNVIKQLVKKSKRVPSLLRNGWACKLNI
jgi:hypothetical protein